MEDSDSDSSVERILNENYSFFRNSFIAKDRISNNSSISQNIVENSLENQVEQEKVKDTEPTDKVNRYANLTLEELNSFAERIKIYHEVGVVVPAKVVPCQNKSKKNNSKKPQRLQQSMRKRKTTYGQGRIGTVCSSFGVKHCMCCNVDKENFNTVGDQNGWLISGNNCNPSINELETIPSNEAQEFDPPTRAPNNQPSTFRSWARRRTRSIETVTNSESTMPQVINLRGVTVRETVEIDESPLCGSSLATSTPIRRLNGINDLDISEIEIDDAEADDECFVEEGTEIAQKNNNDAEKEEDIMDFVDDLLGTTANTIEEEVEERYQRLNETRRVASDAISNAIRSNHDAVQVHEEMDLEHSVILVSVGSPQPILVEEDSLIQITEHDDVAEIVEIGVQTRSKGVTSASCSKQTKTCPKQVESKDEPKKQTSECSAPVRECSICLEPLAKREISATTCGHVFCTECITTAIRSYRMCPICRTKLTLKKIHPLYL